MPRQGRAHKLPRLEITVDRPLQMWYNESGKNRRLPAKEDKEDAEMRVIFMAFRRCLPAAALLAAALLSAGCALPPRPAADPGTETAAGPDSSGRQTVAQEETHTPAAEPADIPADVRVLVVDCSVPCAAVAPEFTEWEKRVTDPAAPMTCPLPWGADGVTGTYRYSVTRTGCDLPTHVYYTPDGTEFGINAGTGLPELYAPGVPPAAAGPDLGEDACREIARELLSGCADPAGFAVTATVEGDLYRFDFTREIGGLPSEESATVTLWRDGSLHSYSSRMLGRIPEDTRLPFAPQQADGWVLTRAAEALAGLDGLYDRVDCGIRARSVTRWGGCAVLRYVLEIQCLRDFGDTVEIDAGVLELLVLPVPGAGEG